MDGGTEYLVNYTDVDTEMDTQIWEQENSTNCMFTSYLDDKMTWPIRDPVYIREEMPEKYWVDSDSTTDSDFTPQEDFIPLLGSGQPDFLNQAEEAVSEFIGAGARLLKKSKMKLLIFYDWAISHREWNRLIHNLHGNGSPSLRQFPYVWAIPIQEWNRLMHNLHGNGMKLILSLSSVIISLICACFGAAAVVEDKELFCNVVDDSTATVRHQRRDGKREVLIDSGQHFDLL